MSAARAGSSRLRNSSSDCHSDSSQTSRPDTAGQLTQLLQRQGGVGRALRHSYLHVEEEHAANVLELAQVRLRLRTTRPLIGSVANSCVSRGGGFTASVGLNHDDWPTTEPARQTSASAILGCMVP